MKYSYTYLLVLALSLSGCAPNDVDGPDPEAVFVKFYGLGTNEAVDMVRTSTGDIIILAQNQVGNHSDFYLIKTDAAGNEIRSRLIDLDNGSNDIPKRIKSMNNEEYLIVGYIEDDESQIDQYTAVWGIIDSELQTLSSSATGGTGFNFMDSLQAVDIIQTSDTEDTYVVLGQSTAQSRRYAGDLTPAGDFQIYMGKVDDEDSVYWEKSHGFMGDETALSLFETDNGGFLVVGSTNSASEEYEGVNLYVLSTNEFGTSDEGALVTGIQGAGLGANDVPYAVKKTSLGYTIVGSTAEENGAMRGFHVAVSSGGSLVNNSVNVLANDFGLECQALTFSRTLNNELMVLGSIPNFSIAKGDGTTSETKLEEILVMRVSPISGHIPGFDQNYGTTIGNDRAVQALTLPDGDVLVTATVDFGSGTTMVGLLRLNEDGELRD